MSRLPLALLLLALPAPLAAQGWIDIERPNRPRGPASVVRVSSSVRAVVEDGWPASRSTSDSATTAA